MLSDRRQRVLAALIEEYVARAMPVGSRTLTENHDLGVSSATIRNELSVLEDEGYITQPHTSAGRIPTDFGYRTFVDNLLESGAITDDADSEVVAKMRENARELDDLLERTSAALAQLTECLTIVAPPELPHPRRMGISSLMRQPEFAYTQSLLPIIQVLEDDTVLLQILDATAEDEETPQVRIGSENVTDQLSGVSVVASRFGRGSGEGIVAVIGPTRMNYTKVLKAVRVASRTLTEE